VLGVEPAAASPGPSFAYHASCHGLRGMGLREQPRRLLRAVSDGRAADLPDGEACCGFGGLFSVKMGPVSGAMLEAKLDAIEASGADVVVATDVSCLMHIGGGLRRRRSQVRTRHIAEVVADAGHA